MLSSALLAGLALGLGQGGSLEHIPPHVPNQLLVKFSVDATPHQRQTALSRAAAQAHEHIETASMRDWGYDGLILAATRKPVVDAIRDLQSMPGVEFAEPNWIYRHSDISNDPYYTGGNLWGMYGDATPRVNQYGSQAGEAWVAGHTGSRSIFVGIIDEGVMHTHPDLKDNIWVNPFDPVNGIDDDGNGYVDDIHGWDFDGNNNSVYDGTQDDHGTHVAGTIGAIGGNGIGVAGVSWKVTMISVKFLGRNGGTLANAVKAFDYLTNLKLKKGLDIVASNNSWGGGGYSQALNDAIERHNAAGILAIVAAGNGGIDGVGDNNDSVPSYPSSYTNANIIAVASITSTGARSSFSNYGATSVDLGAPGSGIYSTVPGKGGKAGYASYSGTSMATPHVTGGAALRAAYSASRGATLKADVLSSTVATASLSGKCVTGGRLNVSGY